MESYQYLHAVWWKVFSGLCSMWMNQFPNILFPITSNQKCEFVKVDHEVSTVVVKVWYLHQCESWRNSNSSLSNFCQESAEGKGQLVCDATGYCSRWTSLMKPEEQQQRDWIVACKTVSTAASTNCMCATIKNNMGLMVVAQMRYMAATFHVETAE